MPHERLRPSFVFDEERLKQLQQIAPEAFADGKINWEVLKESLGERLEEEGAEAEHFGLFWPGKREARKIASIPSKGALIPVKGEGVNEEITKNIFIDGENLEVLKLLQKSYAGKIKMIYIDPPYNTGNDFVYDDNFTEPLEEYLKYTGQMDEEGKLLTTNKKADGRFHSKWLSMMYPRLRLARNLLKDDGVIFISIDDNEVMHLRKICDEIFGEENFESFIWKKKGGAGNTEKILGNLTEYILCYFKSKNPGVFNYRNIERTYKYKDEKGPYNLEGIVKTNLGSYERKTMQFPVIDPEIKQKFYPGKDMRWTAGENTIEKLIEDKRIKFDYDKKKIYVIKRPEHYEESENVYYNLLLECGSLASAKDELDELFGNREIFDTPKPTALIRYLLEVSTDKNTICLDFFAGSATTAHAVLLQNAKDGCGRKYIVIQMPESCEEKSEAYKLGYRNISEIGKERIKRILKELKNEKGKNLDLGFRVFKLEKSSFKEWQDYKGKDPKELTSLFKEYETPLVDGWKSENLLIEVMLQEGFLLDSEIAELKEYKKNSVKQVTSEFCEHKLLVCFDKKIYQETVNALNIQGEDIFVCLDSALSDEQKITLSDKGFLKTI